MILTLNRNKTEGEEANQNLKMTVIRIQRINRKNDSKSLTSIKSYWINKQTI